MYTVWPMVSFAGGFISEETEQVSLSVISQRSAATPTVAVSFALGDLKSCFKMAALDHDRHIITLKHTHTNSNTSKPIVIFFCTYENAQFYLIEPDSLFQHTCYLCTPREQG